MEALPPGQEIPSRRITGVFFLPLGLGTAALAAGYWRQTPTFALVLECVFAALFIYGGATQLIRPPVFVRYGPDGIEFPVWGMRRLAWSDIVGIQVGPLESPDGEGGTTVRVQQPLALRIRSSAPALARMRFEFLPRLPDGTVAWLVELDTCPLSADELIARCRPYLTATGRAQVITDTGPADRSPSSRSAPLAGGIVFAAGGLLFVGIGAWLLWPYPRSAPTHAVSNAAGNAFGAWWFIALGGVAAAFGLAVLWSRFKSRARVAMTRIED
jgi:hypothetical protein